MKKRSLRSNAFLYALKSLVTLVFPIITFPYISRVLGVENVGKVGFSANIVSYFALIAQLGIYTYASREGSRIRNNTDELNGFANEIFTINIISSLIAYILLAVTVMIVSKLRTYAFLIIIQSVSIIGTTLGVEWVCNIYEDYGYIAMRSLTVQVLTMVLLFTCVKKAEDYYLYAAISVFSTISTGMMNFFHVRKFINIRPTRNLHLNIYLKPILIIFFSAIATTIYVNSDTTMIGLIWGDYNNGLYHVSVRIYSMIQVLLASIFLVALPRLSNEYGNNDIESYDYNLRGIFNELLFFLLPVVTGLYMISDQAILLFAGNSFIESGVSLKILSITLLFSTFASFLTNTMLLPMGKEKQALISTVVCAVTNVLLNLLFIPKFAQNGAAFTTLIAELLMVIIQISFISFEKHLHLNLKNVVGVLLGCISIFLCCMITDRITQTLIPNVCIKILLSVFAYISIALMTKNQVLYGILDHIKTRVKRIL